MALPEVVKNVKGGWDNVQSFHIKTNSSVSLPIWTCPLGDGQGARWDGLTTSGKADGETEDHQDVESGEEPRTEKKTKGKRVAESEGQGDKPKKRTKGKGISPTSETESPVSSKNAETSKKDKGGVSLTTVELKRKRVDERGEKKKSKVVKEGKGKGSAKAGVLGRTKGR
jgi:ribosome biogenesis protein UTP30